jgi:hypothetical protein
MWVDLMTVVSYTLNHPSLPECVAGFSWSGYNGLPCENSTSEPGRHHHIQANLEATANPDTWCEFLLFLMSNSWRGHERLGVS